MASERSWRSGPPAATDVEFDAAFQRALELIGKRWTGAILRALIAGPQRYNALLHGIPGISDRLLTDRIRELVEVGLVDREVETDPVRVILDATPRARALRDVFAEVDRWAASWPPAEEEGRR